MSMIPNFTAKETHVFQPKELRVHDVVADPSEHFESTALIQVQIGTMREQQNKKYLPYAILDSDAIILQGELPVAISMYDKRPGSLLLHTTEGNTLAVMIFSHCFIQQRAALMPLFKTNTVGRMGRSV